MRIREKPFLYEYMRQLAYAGKANNFARIWRLGQDFSID
jgi:hypothetical protein